MNRRTFTQTALSAAATSMLANSSSSQAAAAMASAPAPLTPENKEAMNLIDTHQHLWNRSQFTLPWVTKGTILDNDFGIKEYKQATAGIGNIRTIYMEVDVAPKQQWAEAQFVNGLCQDPESGMVAAVVSGRPASAEFGDWVTKLKTLPAIRGIRQVLHVKETPKGFCLQDQFVKSMKILGEKDLSFDLCIRDVDLPQTSKLVGLCPDTRFILDHCGNPDLKKTDLEPWKKDLAEIAKHKNLVIKISGFLASAAAKDQWKYEDAATIVNHCLDSFGPDRCIFGGDWPVVLLGSTLATWIETLKKIVANRPAADQAKLFYQNAERIYRVNPIKAGA